MYNIPQISTLDNSNDFHDSSLISFHYLPSEAAVAVVLSTPNINDVQYLWEIRLSGVLAVEFETLGDGKPPAAGIPPEIYEVYDDPHGQVAKRWTKRFIQLGIPDPNIHVVTFASSILRGWGEKEELEGIRVVCRQIQVEPAPSDFKGMEYSRPRIEGDPN